MSDASSTPTVTAPTADPAAAVAGTPPAPPAPVAPVAPASAPSRAWMGVTALFVVVALLAGATGVLFVRVQEARDRADEAVVIAGNQQVLSDRIDDLDATLASVETSATASADDLDAARDQVSALRRCVNNALDTWAQATQAGKPATITKC
jgi:hypothetical protein